MGKKKFLRNYIGQQLFMLCDDDMEHAAEQQKLPYDMMEEIFESLDANHAIPKETVTKYGKLLKRMPLWKEAEMAYEVECLNHGVLKEHYDYRPEAADVEAAWNEMEGLTDGQLVKVASEVKKQKMERTKAEIRKVREIVVPLLKIYAEKEEVNMDVSDCPDQVSFTVVLHGQNGFACDMSDFLARTVFSLASYIDACRETDSSMRLELTYAP